MLAVCILFACCAWKHRSFHQATVLPAPAPPKYPHNTQLLFAPLSPRPLHFAPSFPRLCLLLPDLRQSQIGAPRIDPQDFTVPLPPDVCIHIYTPATRPRQARPRLPKKRHRRSLALTMAPPFLTTPSDSTERRSSTVVESLRHCASPQLLIERILTSVSHPSIDVTLPDLQKYLQRANNRGTVQVLPSAALTFTVKRSTPAPSVRPEGASRCLLAKDSFPQRHPTLAMTMTAPVLQTPGTSSRASATTQREQPLLDLRPQALQSYKGSVQTCSPLTFVRPSRLGSPETPRSRTPDPKSRPTDPTDPDPDPPGLHRRTDHVGTEEIRFCAQPRFPRIQSSTYSTSRPTPPRPTCAAPALRTPTTPLVLLPCSKSTERKLTSRALSRRR